MADHPLTGWRAALAAFGLALTGAAASADTPPHPITDSRAFAHAIVPTMPGDDPQVDDAINRAWDLFHEWIDVRDNGSYTMLQILSLDLHDLLTGQIAAIEARHGFYSRQMSRFLAETVFMSEAGDDPTVAYLRADHATRIERQFSARSDFFRSWTAAARDGDIGGRITHATGWAVTWTMGAARYYTELGDRDTGLTLLIRAVELAQGYLIGTSAQAVTQRLRRAYGHPDYSDKTVAAVLDLRARMRDVMVLEDILRRNWRGMDSATIRRLHDDIDAERARLDLAIGYFAAEGVIAEDLIYPARIVPDNLFDALGPDSAVMLVVRDHLFYSVIMVTSEQVEFYRSERPVDAVRESARALVAALDPQNVRGGAAVPRPGQRPRRQVVTDEAYLLYLDLFAPAEWMLDGISTVHVVATDALAGLPFAVLLSTPAAEGAGFAQLDWLARRHAFTVLPSVELLLHREAPRPNTSRVYAGFGDPDYARRMPGGSPSAVAAMRPLPESGDEVIAVAELFEHSRIFLNFVASEWTLERLSDEDFFADGGVLHLATHGVAPQVDPAVPSGYLALSPEPLNVANWTPSLAAMSRVLSDGVLIPDEVARMRLPADLVILSACDGAIDPDPLGGVGGLAAGFLEAGARRVMASHWPVNSAAAVEIVTGMMTADPQLRDPAGTLRAVTLDLIAQGGYRADPAYWAPFSLIGAP